MKLHKLIFTIFILFASFQICFGQQTTKTELIAEFGSVNYEVFSAQLDALSIYARNNKNSVGYVVIFGDKNNFLKKYYQEYLIETYADFRKVSDNFIIVHGKDQESFKIQLWIVPEGAEKPNIEEEKWDYLLPQNTKPFILESETDYDKSGCCIEFDGTKPEKFTSRFLLANPNLNAHLVIYSNSTKRFEQTRNKLINKFNKTYKIPRNRLKFFYTKKNWVC